MRKIKLFKKTITFILCALPAGLAVADVSSDRIDTYKSNKLLPSEVQIVTVNSVASNTAGVAVFSPNSLSWNSYSNTMSAAMGKFMDWTRVILRIYDLHRNNLIL